MLFTLTKYHLFILVVPYESSKTAYFYMDSIFTIKPFSLAMSGVLVIKTIINFFDPRHHVQSCCNQSGYVMHMCLVDFIGTEIIFFIDFIFSGNQSVFISKGAQCSAPPCVNCLKATKLPYFSLKQGTYFQNYSRHHFPIFNFVFKVFFPNHLLLHILIQLRYCLIYGRSKTISCHASQIMKQHIVLQLLLTLHLKWEK